MSTRRRVWAGCAITACALVLGACTPAKPQAPSAFKGDPVAGRAVAERVCAACHAVDGNGASDAVPRLAGQYPEYIEKQILAFQSHEGAPPKRISPVMGPIAAGLTAADAANVAAYYTHYRAEPGVAPDPAAVALGRTIYLQGDPDRDLPACVTCHRPTGAGIEPDFPRIGDQKAAYIETQLTQWMQTRAHPGKLMSMIVPHLQPDQRHAVANYIAQLHPSDAETTPP